jgi:hypothetical protein
MLPLVPRDLLDRFHVAGCDDSRFASNARLLQSIWREGRGFAPGVHAGDKDLPPRPLGSRLTGPVARMGHAFVTPDIARLVRREAAYRELGAMMDEERLWANLLSSQPATFNLFGRTKLDAPFAKRLLKKLFPELVAEVLEVRFEHSPGRWDPRFTGDGSAFDVAFVVGTRDKKRALIAIEVKYSETLAQPARPAKVRLDQLASQAGLYVEPDAPALRAEPLAQLFAEHLLAHTTVANALYDRALFVLIAPEGNRQVWGAEQAYRQHLVPEPTVAYESLTTETVIDAIEAAGEPALAAKLRERYTDFSPIHALIDDWQPYAE